jgi:hypothetical protein
MLQHIDVVTILSADRRREALEAARRAELAAAARRPPAQPSPSAQEDLVIRLSRVGEAASLERLATLAERKLPAGQFVVAELAGDVVAALPLDAPGPALRDPFRRTAGLTDLLELRARQVRGTERRRGRLGLRRPARA